jgi:hypothetical protein
MDRINKLERLRRTKKTPIAGKCFWLLGTSSLVVLKELKTYLQVLKKYDSKF